MSAVDLYGGDAGRIRDAYRSSLRRDASDDEVSGWLSGSYGGGGIDDWLRQISGSDEARRHAPPTPPPTPTTPPVVGQPNPNTSGPMGDDPWARAREGLTNVYRQNLGRDPGAGDVDRWLSGQFGYGSGVGDYDKYVAAIMGSPEARAYRPPQTTQDSGYQNLDWWQQRGTPNTDIFDPLTGQLRPGWSRTARGYERTGGGANTPTGNTPTGTAPPPGGYQTWLMGLLGNGPSSQEALGRLEPELARYGIRLQKDSFGVIRGRLYMPDGSVVDVVPPGGWGQPWQWIVRSGAGGSGGGGGAGGPGGPTMPGNQYNDPWTMFLEQVIRQRIGNLGPVNDPYRDMYMEAMQRRTRALEAAEPDYQALLTRMRGRISELEGPGYTGAENEVIRTGALDPIERDRTAARQRVLERLSARGISLESGIAQQALLEVDNAFDAERATTQTTLTTNDIQRREGRSARADQLSGAMYDVGQQRAREQLDTFGAIDALSSLMRGENDARNREAVSLAGALSDLGPQRMQLALQALGSGGSPQSMFQSLMQLAQFNQNSALLQSGQSSRLWSGLGSMAAILSNAGR